MSGTSLKRAWKVQRFARCAECSSSRCRTQSPSIRARTAQPSEAGYQPGSSDCTEGGQRPCWPGFCSAGRRRDARVPGPRRHRRDDFSERAPRTPRVHAPPPALVPDQAHSVRPVRDIPRPRRDAALHRGRQLPARRTRRRPPRSPGAQPGRRTRLLRPAGRPIPPDPATATQPIRQLRNHPEHAYAEPSP